MSPEQVLEAISADRDVGNETPLVELSNLATEYLAAEVEYRRIGDSDVAIPDCELLNAVRRAANAQAALARAVGYALTSPIECIDEESHRRTGELIGRLHVSDVGDLEWQRKSSAVIDRIERRRNRWWRRLGRWLRGE